MGEGDPRVERYLAKDRPFVEERRALRALLLDCGLTETLKWRSPCYTAYGRNVAMVDALKDAAVLSFLSGALLDDPEGLLVPPGPNTRSARCVRLRSLPDIEARSDALRALVLQAVENARMGRRVTFEADDLELPAELVAALDADADLAAAWDALTPGRRRGYVIHVAGAKQSGTRHARIDRHRGAILAGKGLHDR